MVTFDASVEYGAFFHSDIQVLFAMAGRRSSEGGGSVGDYPCAFVVGGDRVVSVLEVFTGAIPRCDFQSVPTAMTARGLVDVFISLPFSPRWSPRQDGSEAWIGLNNVSGPVEAVRLGECQVVLALSAGQRLVGVWVEGIIVEGAAEAEADWVERFDGALD